MGEKKAIIFSTHILEEVDAVCSRAMIIDRGKWWPTEHPRSGKQVSEWAGAVTLRVSGALADKVRENLKSASAKVERVRLTETVR